MGSVVGLSTQGRVVECLRDMIASTRTFQRATATTNTTDARRYVHVVVQQVESGGSYLRPAAIIETPQTVIYPTEKCGQASGACRFWLVKDIPAEYRDNEEDAWMDFANFADAVAQEISLALDARLAATSTSQLFGSSVALAGPYTRNTEDTADDYYLASYVVNWGTR